jgi:DNA-binding MarR family transcriptional regulator
MSPLLDGLGFMMLRVARSMKRALEIKLSDYGLTSSQFAVLAGLWDSDGISLTELGRRLNFDNPTITGIVDRMEREEFLKRIRDDEDRRVIKVFLTRKGTRLKNVLPALAEEVNSFAVNDLSVKDRERLNDFLNSILSQFESR